MQVCKKRMTDDNNYDYDESSLSEDDGSDEFSGINILDTKFFLIGGNKFYNTHSWEDSSDNR